MVGRFPVWAVAIALSFSASACTQVLGLGNHYSVGNGGAAGAGGQGPTGTLVGSKDFESGLDNMGDCFNFNDTLTQTTAQAHHGTHSLAVKAGDISWCVSEDEPFQNVPVVPGHKYFFSMWFRAQSTSITLNAKAEFSKDGYYGGGLVSQPSWGTVTDTSTAWTHLTGTLVAPATSVCVGLRVTSTPEAGSTGSVHYLDDYTVLDQGAS